jgi:hypothetical protein
MDQEFPISVVWEAFSIARGRCQCTTASCIHNLNPSASYNSRCTVTFDFSSRGESWEAVKRYEDNSPTTLNCVIYCSTCIRQKLITGFG